MNLKEIEGRVEALQAGLELDAVDAIWDDSFALGKWGKEIRRDIDAREGCYEYAGPLSKQRIRAIVSLLLGEYACGNIF